MTSLTQKPKIHPGSKGEGFDGWIKCSRCEKISHKSQLKKSLHCCPSCNHHFRISASMRISLLTENFQELFAELESEDPFEFTDSKPYIERLTQAKKRSGNSDAILTGEATIDGMPICLAVMDFSFMGGSMGRCVGEKLTRLIEHACEKRVPLVVCTASGGARMQESTLSLMQMAKTSAALAKLSEEGIPYITLLTNPTSGGVTASFATLGDILLAEPGALICFAGPRVIEQTLRKKLPEGAQSAEFLLQHGLIDAIVERHNIKEKLSELLNYFTR